MLGPGYAMEPNFLQRDSIKMEILDEPADDYDFTNENVPSPVYPQAKKSAEDFKLLADPRKDQSMEVAEKMSKRIEESSKEEGFEWRAGLEGRTVEKILVVRRSCRILEPGLKKKIPRPANAFMLFANKWRKKLAAENPRESNKDISVRLGILWKNMSKDVKEKYFALAREVDAEHKRKYPDYVYNPKEARLRKAMREQSRELSRRSILQRIPASVTGFLDHRFNCVPPSPLLGSSFDLDRAADPWFHRRKAQMPADWYSDPIERLQAMGTMHQASTGLEKSCKEPLRTARDPGQECGFLNRYQEFPVNRDREVQRHDTIQEYGEFSDGQKWHPYQNGVGPHQHPRTPHPQQLPGILHPNVQNANSHGHGRESWGQFCHGVMPQGPTMPRSVGTRGPRHAVFLRDRLPGRHCGYPEENSRIPYNSTKLDMESVQTPYPAAERQMPRLMEPPLDTVMDSTNTRTCREEGEGSQWEPSSGICLDNVVPTTPVNYMQTNKNNQQQDTGQVHERDRECAERFASRKRPPSKQPLPGFHQAFGSTEIGRFSRSEYFVNMVGESEARDGPRDVFPFEYPPFGGIPTDFEQIPRSQEIFQQMLPENCCWFATRPEFEISRILGNENRHVLSNMSQYPDKIWFHQRNPIIQTFLHENNGGALSENQNGSYVIIKEEVNGNYVAEKSDHKFTEKDRSNI